MNFKKYNAYVINLDSAPERWAHMQSEFKDTILHLIRFPAVKHKEGWQGCGESYVKLIREHMKKDPDFTGELLIVLEDDLFRLDSVEVFNERCLKIFKYLEDHKDEYSHFQGGGIYPSGLSIASQDPLLLRCDYITSTTFNVFGKDAAKSILAWDTTRTDAIENFIAKQNRGKMLAPFPHLVWQIIGQVSQIGNANYTRKINNAFRDAKKTMSDFVGKPMMGGRRKRRKQKHHKTKKRRLG